MLRYNKSWSTRDQLYILVKETKRQGRIAHHHADAAVPHIVALLGFSFHAAKMGIFRLSSKLLCKYLHIYIPKMCFSLKFFDNSFCIKRMFLHRKMLLLHRFLWFLGPKTVMICAF